MAVTRERARGRGDHVLLAERITYPAPAAHSTPALTGLGTTESSVSDRSTEPPTIGAAVDSASGARGQEGEEAEAGTGSSHRVRRRPDPATEPHRYMPPPRSHYLDQADLPHGAGWANVDYKCPHCFELQTQHAPSNCPNKCVTCSKKHPTEVFQRFLYLFTSVTDNLIALP
jgi:hypothetical protein